MAELEHDELKGAIEWLESFQVSIDPIVERWSRAILEDRDRLRAAAAAVYVDEAGFCHGIGKLRAALESRDG